MPVLSVGGSEVGVGLNLKVTSNRVQRRLLKSQRNLIFLSYKSFFVRHGEWVKSRGKKNDL